MEASSFSSTLKRSYDTPLEQVNKKRRLISEETSLEELDVTIVAEKGDQRRHFKVHRSLLSFYADWEEKQEELSRGTAVFSDCDPETVGRALYWYETRKIKWLNCEEGWEGLKQNLKVVKKLCNFAKKNLFFQLRDSVIDSWIILNEAEQQFGGMATLAPQVKEFFQKKAPLPSFLNPHRPDLFYDLYIKVGDNVIPCNRALLAARSLFFRNLFKENSSNSLEPPFSPPVLAAWLNNIASGQCLSPVIDPLSKGWTPWYVASQFKLVESYLAISQAEQMDRGLSLILEKEMDPNFLERFGPVIKRISCVGGLPLFSQTIQNFPHLEEIYLKELDDFTLLSCLHHCSKINVISLENCPQISDRALSSTPARVKGLSLNNLQVGDAALKAIATKCQNLSQLSLISCPNVSDASLDAFKQHTTHMRSLILSNCRQITPFAIADFLRRHKELERLYLNGFNLMNTPVIGTLMLPGRTLHFLSLAGCLYSENQLYRIATHCTRLHTLHIALGSEDEDEMLCDELQCENPFLSIT